MFVCNRTGIGVRVLDDSMLGSDEWFRITEQIARKDALRKVEVDLLLLLLKVCSAGVDPKPAETLQKAKEELLSMLREVGTEVEVSTAEEQYENRRRRIRGSSWPLYCRAPASCMEGL